MGGTTPKMQREMGTTHGRIVPTALTSFSFFFYEREITNCVREALVQCEGSE